MGVDGVGVFLRLVYNRTACGDSSVSCSTGEMSGGLFIVREDRKAGIRKSRPDPRSARKGRPLPRGWRGVQGCVGKAGSWAEASCNKKPARHRERARHVDR